MQGVSAKNGRTVGATPGVSVGITACAGVRASASTKSRRNLPRGRGGDRLEANKINNITKQLSIINNNIIMIIIFIIITI